MALAIVVCLIGLIAGPASAQKDATQSLSGQPATASGPPKLDAKAWILIDPRDGEVLASKSPNKPLPIASTTKLMTAYLALQNLKPSQRVKAPAYHPSASAEITLGLRPGEKMSVHDLLYGLLLPSASDAAETLAVGVAGSEAAFVDQMNQAAQQLGLTDTSYANPIGLDDPNNYSSAHDLVTLASTLLQDPLFARIVDTPSATLRSGDHPRTVTSRNTLLDQVSWVDGVKTGHTLGAGYVLVGSGTQNGTTLISAVLGTGSEAARDAETLELLEYGFSLYRTAQPVERGEELADPKLDYRDEHLPLIAKEALKVDYRQGQVVDTQVNAPDEVSGDIDEGQALGKVTVTVDGKAAASTALVAEHAVGAATFLDKVLSAVLNPILLIALGAIVILVGVLLAARGRHTGDPASNGARPRRAERQAPRQRTPEERRRMHEERMRRRRQRTEREEGG